MLAEITRPVRIGRHELNVSASVGVVERDDWRIESWSTLGTTEEFARDYRGKLDAMVRAPDGSLPRASLLCLENTHNGGGGIVTPAAEQATIAAAARELGLKVLLDGARLWNTHVATGTPLAAFAASADFTMLSFAKGLGAPVGAALAGAKAG